MKRKIKNIYIDGLGNSGKTSVSREIKHYLSNKINNLHTLKGTTQDTLSEQMKKLSEGAFILKENSVLSDFHTDLENNKSYKDMETEHFANINTEKDINNNSGAAHFFLIPTMEKTAKILHLACQTVPDNWLFIRKFYLNINQYTMTQGLDINLIEFEEWEQIYDVRDKIISILDEKYEL